MSGGGEKLFLPLSCLSNNFLSLSKVPLAPIGTNGETKTQAATAKRHKRFIRLREAVVHPILIYLARHSWHADFDVKLMSSADVEESNLWDLSLGIVLKLFLR